MRRLSDLVGQARRYVGRLIDSIFKPLQLAYLIPSCAIYHNVIPFVLALFLDSRTRANDDSLQILPSGRSSRSVGPGIEVRDDPAERMRREQDLDDITSLE